MGVEGLRAAVDEDAWGLIALIGACWAEYPGCVMDVERECPELLAPALHYQSKGGTLWVVPEGNWIAAVVGLGPVSEGTVELVKLYVARHRRGQGIGQALIGWAEMQARARAPNAEAIELWSDSRFDDAHRLYQRCGFTPTGKTRDLHDLSNTTEHHFQKLLAAPPPVLADNTLQVSER